MNTVSASAVAELLKALSRGIELDRSVISEQFGDDPDLVGSFSDLSATLTRWKQKDRERSALLESASELIRVRDTKNLLEKLVDRARTLIGCDIAYLSQYYPDTDELRVQAVRGAISAKLKELRVPPGIGLAGRVVHDRAAHWTSDYDVTQLPHERRVDSAVQAEHMESLLGVPMVVDDEVLGALFAANRYSHDFSADEIALLTALADHASVVLKTARLMGDLAEAARVSAQAEESAAAQANTLRRLVEVEEHLTQLVLQGKGVAAVTDAISDLLDANVLLVESTRLESSDTARNLGSPLTEDIFADTDIDRTDLIIALGESRRTGRSAEVAGESTLLAASVASHRRQHSGLFVRFRSEPADGDANIVAQAAQSLALIRMNEQARADADNRARGELAVDLIANTRRLEELEARALSNDIDLTGPWQLTAVRVEPDDVAYVRSRLTRVEPRVLLTQRSPGLTVLIPSSVRRERPDLDDVIAASGALTGTMTVVSWSDVHRAELREAEDELWSCVRILDALGLDDGIHEIEDFAPYTAMFGSAPEQVERFVERMIGPLRHWDLRHSAELVDTLRSYFESGSSVSRTATARSIHVNTAKQRLERIDTILGTGWRAPERAFRLQVALRLAKLASDD